MSLNFSPQPHFTGQGLSVASMHAPIVPTINTPLPTPNLDTQSYFTGAIEMNGLLGDQIQGESATDNIGFFYGVVSFWMQYSPSGMTVQGWPRIGQDGTTNMLPYFGTDPAHGTMGTIDIELVLIKGDAIEFPAGAN